MRYCAIPLLICLAACEAQAPVAQEEVQRVPLSQGASSLATAEPSPDVSNAIWTVADDGKAIRFGDDGAPPLLTLGCDVTTAPPELIIIRHAKAYPGQSALFPIIGNGVNSRFKVDAVLGETGDGSKWHWEARLPADDPQLEVFSGTRDIIATLPGRGTLEIGGGRIAGEFLDWCRSAGQPASEQTLIEEDGGEDTGETSGED
ncbi:hypothetical protein [Aurantiacibacter rhizosphaerae]|uniref:Uncharacterized protein n=1 Tax=Aurantiacibacter rhizosphaerae TaxID=2691582 RepID=A0A844XFY7_9SPHN|nr:hypothetical protein [Aurantiacibacter rhizosphaerae]MWV28572.1 hypothetical protein [Aurantiacibacter rhizosphaerae]